MRKAVVLGAIVVVIILIFVSTYLMAEYGGIERPRGHPLSGSTDATSPGQSSVAPGSPAIGNTSPGTGNVSSVPVSPAPIGSSRQSPVSPP
ncbi:MAG: hypothetical protein ABFC24_03340 [Methanoregulaceae archaeon]